MRSGITTTCEQDKQVIEVQKQKLKMMREGKKEEWESNYIEG